VNPYSSPFWITEKTSNNNFAWAIRRNPKLYVPALIEGGLSDVMEGDEVVFEDVDDSGMLQPCKGLRNFVFMRHPETGAPIYIVDNHNHVFYFWHEALSKSFIQKGATLLHVDGHRDTRIPDRNPTSEELGNLDKLAIYANTVLNVGNYIPPALETGLLKENLSVISEKEMKEHAPRAIPNLIVNIDLDFWAPELDYIAQDFKDSWAKAWMKEASLITFATSPFFIEQKRAIEVFKRLIS
jgi:hypothetical protein